MNRAQAGCSLGTPMTEDFLEKLARPQPDPGGGAAAAYAGRLALALLEKVVQLERRRRRQDATTMGRWARLSAAATSLSEEFSRLLVEDIEAYEKLQKAMSKGDPAALREAVDDAVECPLRIMAGATSTLPAIIEAGMHCKKHLLADLLVAAELLGAVIQGAFHIASPNVPLLADSAAQQECRARLGGALAAGLESLERARKALSACPSESLPPDKNQQKTN